MDTNPEPDTLDTQQDMGKSIGETAEQQTKNSLPPKTGLLAGGGQFPILLAKKAREQGHEVFVVGFHGETANEIADLADQSIFLHLGQINRVIRFFQTHGVHQAIMAGTIKKTNIFKDLKPDFKALSFIAKNLITHDDTVLSSLSNLLLQEGIKIVPSTLLMPEIISPKGCWTKKKPDRSQKNDIRLGWEIAGEIGSLDIGQCVVVSNGSVIAVEAVEGTDAAIARAGELSGQSGCVVVKRCKPNQDQRFDLPATGIATVETMIRAGANVLVLEAGKSVVFDREAMIELADRRNICIIGLTHDGMP